MNSNNNDVLLQVVDDHAFDAIIACNDHGIIMLSYWYVATYNTTMIQMEGMTAERSNLFRKYNTQQ